MQHFKSLKMLQKFILCSVCSADNTIYHCSPKTMLLILPLLAYVWASDTFIRSITIALYTLWISKMQLQTDKHTFNIRIEKMSQNDLLYFSSTDISNWLETVIQLTIWCYNWFTLHTSHILCYINNHCVTSWILLLFSSNSITE